MYILMMSLIIKIFLFSKRRNCVCDSSRTHIPYSVLTRTNVNVGRTKKPIFIDQFVWPIYAIAVRFEIFFGILYRCFG